MLRFTIRELMTLTLAVGMLIAWLLDRGQLKAATEKASAAEIRKQYLQWQIDNVDKQLIEKGLRIAWVCGHPSGIFPFVGEIPADEPGGLQELD